MEAMLLKPAGKAYLWGGMRLKKEYGKCSDLAPLAETWECSCHPEGVSTVASGEFCGQKLDLVLREHPEFLGSKFSSCKDLPILIKFIDAEKDLSVQVHPTDEYARKTEGQNGKNEMWYVVDARPDASIILGFAHKVTREQLQEAIRTKQLKKHLCRVKVKKGDVFYIPAGTIHAVGEGVLLVEIQQNSNLTYRLYDYERTDRDGNKREVHFDKAMDVLNMKRGIEVRQRPRQIRYYKSGFEEFLWRCPWFEVKKTYVNRNCSFEIVPFSFQVLLCLEGGGELQLEGHCNSVRFSKGNCVFIPAGTGTYSVTGKAAFLKIRC